jgi:serine/threonine protein kinase
MSYELTHLDNAILTKETKAVEAAEDYLQILQHYHLSPTRVDFHLMIGETKLVQGWLLHVSIVRSQVGDVLFILIPMLISTGTPFKIVKDKNTAVSVLDGNLGQEYIGKILTIYPEDDQNAFKLAKMLISLTKLYKGPRVLTDIHLGGNVYTRYGGFKPVIRWDAGGNETRFIYNLNGELVKDDMAIPYVEPAGIAWPFQDLNSQNVRQEKGILNNKYKPLSNLKIHPRGNVIRAHYIHSLFDIKTCIIKQAKKNMWSDDDGRDLADRLLWQQELYNLIKGAVPTPKVMDVFQEQGDTYLAMEYIKSKSLFDCFSQEINPNCEWWELWSSERKNEVLDHLLKICEIIQKLHQLKIVHRDITPVNFLVDKNRNLVLIDFELAYSLTMAKPFPPFQFGTHGFISPEQAATSIPTVKEDIYGLGATILALLTGMPPLVFDISDPVELERNVAFFVRNAKVVSTIVSCLERSEAKRPFIEDISTVLQQYKVEINEVRNVKLKYVNRPINKEQVRGAIVGAITGLVTPPMLIHKELWQSKIYRPSLGMDRPSDGYGKSGGFFEGISGVLYTVAAAKLQDFDISPCLKCYEKNWKYLHENYLKEVNKLPPGLAGGAAGIALAVAQGMRAGLIADNQENRSVLRACFEIQPYGLDQMNGISGQGMAAILCSDYLENTFLLDLLQKYVASLNKSQDKRGNWVMFRSGKSRPITATGLYQGNAGINLFLLAYYSRYKDPDVLATIMKTLLAFEKIFPALQKHFRLIGFRNHLLDTHLRDGYKGIILNFIEAYKLLNISRFKKLSENAMISYSSCVVHEDISKQYGLSGIGELYLKAYDAFRNEQWMDRADWIVQLYCHTSLKNMNGSRYWLSNNVSLPTADLMPGNSGVLLFLLKYFKLRF